MTSQGADELRTRALLRTHHVRPFGHEPPQGTAMPATPPEKPRWWEVRKEPADEPPPEQPTGMPDVHVHITPQPQPSPVDPATATRRARTRRWLAIHGAAAGTGWTFGLYDAFAYALRTTGDGGVPMGLALAGMSYVAADLILTRYGRFVPQRLRPAAAWVLHIPFATALLATALYAPHALI